MTILSGDIGTVDDNTDNAIHVMCIDGTTGNGDIIAACIIDGFQIEKGNANADFPHNGRGAAIVNKGDGAGNICSPTIRNCTFSNHTAGFEGGAIFNYGLGGNSSPTISNCTFNNNSATERGGAVYIDGFQQGNSSPVITNCVFRNNSSADGGAIYLFGNDGVIAAQFNNCLFDNNGSTHIGYNDGDANGQPQFTNCTFSEATSHVINITFWDSGQTPIDFTNCIFWGNNGDIVGGFAGMDDRVNIQYSIVEEDAFSGVNNNILQNPLFVNTANGGFRLKTGSPALNVGDNTIIPANSLDLAGNLRIADGTVDMGCYEGAFAALAVHWLDFSVKLMIED